MKTSLRIYGWVLALFFLGLVLTGCATGPRLPPPEPVVVTKEVLIPVSEPCKALADLGPEPDYPDTPEAIAAAPNVFALAKLYRSGMLLRSARLGEYIAARWSCQ